MNGPATATLHGPRTEHFPADGSSAGAPTGPGAATMELSPPLARHGKDRARDAAGYPAVDQAQTARTLGTDGGVVSKDPHGALKQGRG